MSERTSAFHTVADNLARPAWAGHYTAALAEASQLGVFDYEAQTYASVAATLAERREASAEAARAAVAPLRTGESDPDPNSSPEGGDGPSPEVVRAGWRRAFAGLGILTDQPAEPNSGPGVTPPAGTASNAGPPGGAPDATAEQAKAGWAAAFARLPSGH